MTRKITGQDEPGRAGVRAEEPGLAGPPASGSFRSRMTAKVMIPTSTPTANRSSRKPTHAQCPMPGMANVLLNRSP